MTLDRHVAVRVANLICWTFVFCATVHSQQQPSQADRDAAAKANIQSLWEQAQKLRGEGNLKAAMETTQKILAIERKSFGGPHRELINSLNFLAELQEAVEDDIAAETSRAELHSLNKQVFGETDWQTADARRALETARFQRQLSSARRRELQSADQMNRAAVSLSGERKHNQAIAACQNALAVHTSILGEQHPRTVNSLANLAAFYHAQGDHAQAERLCSHALAIRTEVLGERHPDTLGTMNDLAAIYASLRDYAKAESLYQRCLEMRKEVLGPRDQDTDHSLNNLAALYSSMGDPAKAEQLYLQSREIREAVLGKQHPYTAECLNNLATVYDSLGQYAQAESLYRQSLAIARDALGEHHPDIARSLGNLALLYHRQGEFARAMPLYRSSLEILQQSLGEEHPDAVTCLNNLAGLYDSLGDFAQAEVLFHRSLEIRKRVLGEQHPDTAISLNNLAMLYADRGDSAAADPLLQQSLTIRQQILGEEHPDTATSLNNLATLYHAQRDFVRAESLARRSLEIERHVFGEKHLHTASSLNNLAVIYQAQGEWEKAEADFRQSMEIRKAVLGERHPDTARSFSNLAILYGVQGHYLKAEPLFREALLGARASLQDAAIIQSERQQLAMAQGLRPHLDSYLSLATASRQFSEPAFREVLSWKGATLVRQQQMRKVAEDEELAPLFLKLQKNATRLATTSRLTPDLELQDTWRKQITELTAEKERLEAELSQRSAAFRAAKVGVTLEDLLIALPEDAALVDFLEYTRHLPLPDGHAQDARTVPSTVRSMLAFVVRRNTPIVLLDLGPVAPISEAIDTWRTTFGTSRDSSAAGRLLREKLWDPVEQHLGSAELILVSVDGALGRLPIAALPGREPGTFLLEDRRLAMLPVPQLLPALVDELGRKELSGGLLLMGDVDYDAESESAPAEPNRKSWKRSNTSSVRGDTHFAPLAATAGEIATIKELFTGLFQPDPAALKTLNQAAATEQEFRDSASHFYNLHLATHGFFAAAEEKSALAGDTTRNEQLMLTSERDKVIRGFNPGLLSGLAFSGANRKPEPDKDDGILTADEIASLSLDGVNLVVLSACETGLGEVAGGEGLLGVQRAFQVAGAQSTVASLWQVDDVATRQLMERFYRNYWEQEMSKLDALRDAQLYLLNHPEAVRGDRRLKPANNEPKRLSPEFWAAFVLSGDWR